MDIDRNMTTQNSNSMEIKHKFNINSKAKVIRQVKGGITFTEGNTLHGICPHYVHWGCDGCHGKCINTICNFNRFDIQELKEDPDDCLIANKFNLDVDPLAVSIHFLDLLRTVCSDNNNCDNAQWMSYFSKIGALMS